MPESSGQVILSQLLLLKTLLNQTLDRSLVYGFEGLGVWDCLMHRRFFHLSSIFCALEMTSSCVPMSSAASKVSHTGRPSSIRRVAGSGFAGHSQYTCRQVPSSWLPQSSHLPLKRSGQDLFSMWGVVLFRSWSLLQSLSWSRLSFLCGAANVCLRSRSLSRISP